MAKIQNILTMQKRELEKTLRAHYIRRDIQLPAPDKDIIKVIIGPRRSGKSFFTIHELNKVGTYGYANFDDEALVEVDDYNDIIETIQALYQKTDVIFLDEIQNLPKWELFVNRLQRQGYCLVVTGSNSRLLSRELASHLTGRYLPALVFPFSFKEYLRYYYPGDVTTSEIKTKLSDYLQSGGFPEPLVKDLNLKQYLSTLHDSVIFKDIIKRHKIRASRGIAELSRYLLSNPGALVSYRNLAKICKVKSEHTITKYLGHLEEAFLFFQVTAFSFKVRNQVKAPKKIYAVDNGLITSLGFRVFDTLGVLYENLAAIELKRRELNGELEFYYYKTRQDYEVDFVIKQALEVTQLVQVSYNITDEKTKSRETRALVYASKELNCTKLMVITDDYEGEETVEWYGIKRKIRFIPLWRWLLLPDFTL
ncbi:MAG: ATP-binding protein [Candidatus Aminicenantes bacterium]|nr:MAG: ATP-binding protein [Candidatus Aminicenantes bacterium]